MVIEVTVRPANCVAFGGSDRTLRAREVGVFRVRAGRAPVFGRVSKFAGGAAPFGRCGGGAMGRVAAGWVGGSAFFWGVCDGTGKWAAEKCGPLGFWSLGFLGWVWGWGGAGSRGRLGRGRRRARRRGGLIGSWAWSGADGDSWWGGVVAVWGHGGFPNSWREIVSGFVKFARGVRRSSAGLFGERCDGSMLVGVGSWC